MASEPKFRRPLNPSQLVVLEWLYKVRFSTSKQIALRLKISNHKVVQDKLRILEERSLIAKHYDKSYKLAGRPAEYFLRPDGARKLPKDKTNRLATNTLYKNKTVSSRLRIHSLAIANVLLKLESIYGTSLRMYTKSDMAPYDYFPTWKPDIFLSLKTDPEAEPKRFFLDIWDETQPFFVSVRKIRNYILYADTNGWPPEAGGFHLTLFVCPDGKTQAKLNRQIKNALDEKFGDITFATIAYSQLSQMSTSNKNKKIWIKIDSDGVTNINLQS